MSDSCIIVIDVGKTHAKASLWGANGRPIANRSRANAPQQAPDYRALDVQAIDQWLIDSLTEFAQAQKVSHIVTVAHGAAATLLQGGHLYAAPMDYETDVSAADRAEYDLQRDPFESSGSPSLPGGLNLGMQLHLFEKLRGPIPDDVTIVPWPQYWAWRLCGIAATEVSSLGCHTDLWQPAARQFSLLAVRRRWAARMSPLRAAGDTLGAITRQVARQTGLPADCVVLCGLHDSNAALLDARAHPDIAVHDATVLSTGTWFVAMRSLAANNHAADNELNIAALPVARDCLVNVDIAGRPVPSARLMGGREAEIIGGADALPSIADVESQTGLTRIPSLIANDAAAFPSFVAGVGPFPASIGRWQNRPEHAVDRRVIVDLYLALMTNASLDLIGSKDRLLIEGRFAKSAVFVRALATLRPEQRILVSTAGQDVALGALRLAVPQLPPSGELTRVPPLDIDLRSYAARWRANAYSGQSAA